MLCSEHRGQYHCPSARAKPGPWTPSVSVHLSPRQSQPAVHICIPRGHPAAPQLPHLPIPFATFPRFPPQRMNRIRRSARTEFGSQLRISSAAHNPASVFGWRHGVRPKSGGRSPQSNNRDNFSSSTRGQLCSSGLTANLWALASDRRTGPAHVLISSWDAGGPRSCDGPREQRAGSSTECTASKLVLQSRRTSPCCLTLQAGLAPRLTFTSYPILQ